MDLSRDSIIATLFYAALPGDPAKQHEEKENLE